MSRFVPGENVAAANERRRGCRAGLYGVHMRHQPTGEEFVCAGSYWDRDGTLWIYTRQGTPKSPDEIVRAADCVLLSRWPVVCCRPGRKRVVQTAL